MHFKYERKKNMKREGSGSLVRYTYSNVNRNTFTFLF